MPSTFTSRSHNSNEQSLSRADVYTRVTDQIVKAIEAGAQDFKMPWHSPGASSDYPINLATGNRYRGVNTLALWAEAHERHYPEAKWATYRQFAELGLQVRKGSRSAIGVFWKPFDAQKGDAVESHDAPRDADDSRTRWIARAFPLFNIAQTEGYEAPTLPPRPGHERIAHAEAFMAAIGAEIRHGGNRAFYRPSDDFIQMPPFEVFVDPIAYYGTLAHEFGHWTGHESRLNRDLKIRFGDEKYAAEELIAELTAAYISADLGLAPEPKQENAAYIQNWLKILKSDKRAIFTAARHAQAAADYVHSMQPEPAPIAMPTAPAGAAQQQLCL